MCTMLWSEGSVSCCLPPAPVTCLYPCARRTVVCGGVGHHTAQGCCALVAPDRHSTLQAHMSFAAPWSRVRLEKLIVAGRRLKLLA
jgi:hypothetical protein